ncbi:MAG: antitoxin [Candidatus Aminicenantales bacterium]|jgi:plasmid stability protein
MATLQVKGMDDRLYEALRARAAMDNRSVSQEVVAIVRDYLARPAGDVRKAGEAFLELIGSWEGDETPEEAAAALREARRSGRRFKVPDVPA